MEQFVKFLTSLQSYFNDFIGAVAPAIVLVVALPLVSGLELPSPNEEVFGDFYTVAVVVVLFAVGHILIVISELLKNIGLGPHSRKKSKTSAPNDAAATELAEILKTNGFAAGTSFPPNVLRNIAMTLSDDGKELGRRFMFIALFCYGTATAALVSAVAGVAMCFVRQSIDWLHGLTIAGAVVVWQLLLLRGAQFESRARTVPTSTALAEILMPRLGIGRRMKADEKENSA